MSAEEKPHLEECVAIEYNVLRSDRSSHILRGGRHKLDCLLGGDVLHDNAQVGQLLPQRLQLLLYEYLFPVKHVDVAVSHFSMNQEE